MLKKVSLLVILSAFGQFVNECQKNYDVSLYIMPNDQSVYLEARNQIFNAKNLEVECESGIITNFIVSKHLSFFNTHVLFRAFLGKSENITLSCLLKIDDFMCRVNNDIYTFSSEKYIPQKNSELNPKISLLETNDTRNGFYYWTQDELLVDINCENDLKEMRDRAKLNTKIRNYNEENLMQDQRVYLSMTTSPARLLKLHYVLRSLDLTLIDTIFITLPLEFKRKDRYTIPIKLLKEFPQIQFLSITQDLGPILKSVSAVEYVRSVRGLLSNIDIFIQLDDDNCYFISTIDTLVYFSLLNPNSPISGNTALFSFYGMSNFGYPFSRNRKIIGENIRSGHIVEGYLGIAYRGIHLDVELIKALTRRDLNPELSSCYLSDDLVVSFVLSFGNLQLLGVVYDYRGGDIYSSAYRKDFHYFEDENALHLKNSDDSNLKEWIDWKESNSNRTFHEFSENIDWRMAVRYRICYSMILKYFLDFNKENINYKSRNEVLESLYSSYSHEVK